MKVAYISDIHGNADALDAVLQDIETQQADKIIVLGDIAFRGPEPKRSVGLIRNLDTDVIKGNADEWVVRGIKEGEVPDKALELMKKERDWTVSQLEKDDVDYLAGLPHHKKLEIDGIFIHAFHATPDSLFKVVSSEADDTTIGTNLLKEPADLYLYGHIHKSYVRTIKGKTIVNLGSVGLPFDGIAKASYAIVDIKDGSVSTTIRKVDYDVEKTIEKYRRNNYPNTDMMEKVIRQAVVQS
ncbi:metallophosphoesterase family protein [Sediminibacillus halophilus]|uniref:Phosphoesterase, MJ0936 family n=1 Tax=Sediminibacillus halophilus TaxID=482461 RepID=A0A1G9RVR8_9BACI|nr:metallophosphoesterase family protein [Sediminibacillus halophilus]SDM27359.1 phosphoesterase, MJ0936 family [Sediminibacillus halophilus]